MGWRHAVAFIFLANCVLAGIAPAGMAGDITITTDPLAAALMPKPDPISPTFMPSFIRPPGRIFSFELPHEMQSPDRFPSPGYVPRSAQAPNTVQTTTPSSNTLFTNGSMIPLGWLAQEQEVNPGDPPTKVQIPIRYEIYVSRHDTWTARIYVKHRPTANYYTYNFSPPGPGRYHWHVRAVYNQQMHGHNSATRSFMVLP